MLRWRLLLGTLLIAALCVLGWLDQSARVPGVWLLPVAVVAALLGGQELLAMAATAGYRPAAWPVHCGNLLLLAACWAPIAWPALPSTISSAGVILLALAAGTLLVFVAAMRRYEKPGGTLAELAVSVLALVYIGLMLSFVVTLRLSWGMGALAALLLVVKMGDVGAYTVGRLVGRHKMAPKLSPGKTIEGGIGALAFSSVTSWATFAWLGGQGPQFGWLVFGLLVGGVGMFGDLAESLLKRDVGCKDSSTWLPGFGGVLDIVDSILLAAPVAWFCWSIGLVGR